MLVSTYDLRKLIKEALEESVEEQIEDLRSEPEFKSLEKFIEYKLDNDEFEYNFLELHALARNMTQARIGKKMKISVAGADELDQVKNELNKMGFEFIGRKPTPKTRGFLSSAHGTHPFANSGGGGSGFGNGGFTSHGGGPGAIGGGTKWDINDPRNLSMGAKKKR